ncbi:hypothetical protein [Kurthia senegalensis]|uniref:hypothetical protein n=1 Tax=Kurthia senegalensis TaxID=1033740 RepID=UPI000288118A|nr:hypothetical protein [Kurthia senegalensis]
MDIDGEIQIVKTGVDGVIDIRLKGETGILEIEYDGLVKEIKSSSIELTVQTLTAAEQDENNRKNLEIISSFYKK